MMRFFIDLILLATLGPAIDSASNRNEYYRYQLGGKDNWCIGLTTLPCSCANFLEILAPRSLMACTGFAYQHDGNYKVNKRKVYPRMNTMKAQRGSRVIALLFP